MDKPVSKRGALLRFALFVLVLCILTVPVAAKVGDVLAATIKAAAAHVEPAP